MGFFDKFLGKGQPDKDALNHSGELPRAELAAAAEHLAAGRKTEAIAIHESLIAAQPESGELLTAISADLGRNGCLEEMLALLTHVYDAGIHGAGAGLNLIQACLHRADAEGAQMWIDVIAALNRPELANRLAGFAHAAAELRNAASVETPPPAVPRPDDASVNLASISRPLWSYAVPEGESLLPAKQGRLRSIAVMTFAAAGPDRAALDPDHRANLWARAFPFAIAEALAFAPTWQSKAMIGILDGNKLFTPPRSFGLEQVRGLFRSGKDASDFAIAGTLIVATDRIEVLAEVFDVQRDRSMKVLAESCALESVDTAFASVFEKLRQYLEAATSLAGPLTYSAPAAMTERFVALDHALAFFLVDKAVVPADFLGDAESRAAALDAHAAASPDDPIAPLFAQGARAILAKLRAG
ncbi:MAG TPA: hypothetical protein VMM36_03155 [Opitutaceae bacterium]|nr:hypothetical protein [Opitutaceae bacterium]